MRPISSFLTDYIEAETDTPDRVARLERLAQAVERARADLADALAAWSAALNENAGVRRAGRLLREIGYEVPQPAPPPVDPEPEPEPEETAPDARTK